MGPEKACTKRGRVRQVTPGSDERQRGRTRSRTQKERAAGVEQGAPAGLPAAKAPLEGHTAPGLGPPGDKQDKKGLLGSLLSLRKHVWPQQHSRGLGSPGVGLLGFDKPLHSSILFWRDGLYTADVRAEFRLSQGAGL